MPATTPCGALSALPMIVLASASAIAQATTPAQAPAKANATAPSHGSPSPQAPPQPTAIPPSEQLPEVVVTEPIKSPKATKPKTAAKATAPANASSKAKPSEPGLLADGAGAVAGVPAEGSQSTGEATAFSPVQGYVATRSASGTKTDTPLREIPQSISVVGREQIRDQGARSVQETLRYVPGIVADLFGEDTRTDSIAIRGQEATVQFLDGLRRFYGNYLNAPRVDTYTLERIEVLRGPSSVLYGQSGVGGTVNLVSKRPQETRQREVSVGYGSFDAKEVKFDVTGPATDDGKWLYRLVGLGRDAGTQVDFVSDDRLLFAPSFTYRPNSDTSVTLLAQVSRDRGGSTLQFLPHEGTLFAGPNGFVPINRFVGEPDFDRYDADSRSVSLVADHKINDTWSFHQGIRYAKTDVTYAQIFPFIPDRTEPFLDPERRTVERDVVYFDTSTSTVTSDTNLLSKFDLGFTHHKVLGGFDYSRANQEQRRAIAADASPFDIFSPTYGQLQLYDPFTGDDLDELPIERQPDQTQWQAGLYLQDQIRIGPWIAVLGLRKDWTTTAVAGQVDEDAEAVTRRAGLLYELPNGLTPYVSYAESFVPVSGASFFNRPFQPLEGTSIEVGLKYQPPGTSFVINSAVYDATEQNRLAEDPDHPGFSIQSEEVRLKGFEIEAKGNLTPNIKLIAGYSYLDATYAAGDQAGFRVESLPQHVASLWAVYTFNEGHLKGLSLGGGVRYNGPSWDGFDVVKTPSFTLFDAMIAYETDQWRWSLNGTNLEDEYHLNTCLNRGDCFVGARRKFTTEFAYKF